MDGIINAKRACDECEKNILPKTRIKIGQTVSHEEPFGKGWIKTEYQYFQCQICGSIWQTTIDTGVGGHGKHHTRLTKTTF